MAHSIYEKDIDVECPRCKSKKIRIAVYHFGATYTAECFNCGYGKSYGDDEDMAIARHRGECLK